MIKKIEAIFEIIAIKNIHNRIDLIIHSALIELSVIKTTCVVRERSVVNLFVSKINNYGEKNTHANPSIISHYIINTASFNDYKINLGSGQILLVGWFK